MNKRGQFYIMAAILIVLALFGMASISTYAVVKPEPRTIYDLSKDLDRESYNVLEYGTYNNEDLTELSESFAGEDVAEYFLKKTDDANIVFVYGDKNDLNFLSYETVDTGNIRVGGTNWQAHNTHSRKRHSENSDFENNFVKINILDKDYFFELKDNEMFYFVIAKKRGDETFVERNEKFNSRNRPGGAERRRN